jgi:hypothetical protein
MTYLINVDAAVVRPAAVVSRQVRLGVDPTDPAASNNPKTASHVLVPNGAAQRELQDGALAPGMQVAQVDDSKARSQRRPLTSVHRPPDTRPIRYPGQRPKPLPIPSIPQSGYRTFARRPGSGPHPAPPRSLTRTQPFSAFKADDSHWRRCPSLAVITESWSQRTPTALICIRRCSIGLFIHAAPNRALCAVCFAIGRVVLNLALPRVAWRTLRRDRERADYWRWVWAYRRRYVPQMRAAITANARRAELHVLRSAGMVRHFISALRQQATPGSKAARTRRRASNVGLRYQLPAPGAPYPPLFALLLAGDGGCGLRRTDRTATGARAPASR